MSEDNVLLSSEVSDESAEELENTGDESDSSSKISMELNLDKFSSQKIVKRKIAEIEEGS